MSNAGHPGRIWRVWPWGNSGLGINLVSLIAALREEARLPYRTIQWYLQNRASTVPERGNPGRGHPSGGPAGPG